MGACDQSCCDEDREDLATYPQPCSVGVLQVSVAESVSWTGACTRPQHARYGPLMSRVPYCAGYW